MSEIEIVSRYAANRQAVQIELAANGGRLVWTADAAALAALIQSLHDVSRGLRTSPTAEAQAKEPVSTMPMQLHIVPVVGPGVAAVRVTCPDFPPRELPLDKRTAERLAHDLLAFAQQDDPKPN